MKLKYLIGILLATFHSYGASDYQIQRIPNWINYINPEINYDKQEGDLLYLLQDEQFHAEEHFYYKHLAYKVINEKGIQSALPVTISFNPAFQKLIIHNIKVYRNGIAISQDINKITQVFRRETEAENYIINGLLTAYINIPDIRVGDIIDFDYSIKGANPVLGNKKSYIGTLNESVFIHRMRTKVLYSKERVFKYRVKENNEPKKGIENNIQTLEWDLKDVEPLETEEHTPTWFNPYNIIEITEYQSWEEVNNWALETLLKGKETGYLCKVIHDSLNYGKLGKYTYLLRTVQFVQDNIRYMSEASGIYSHMPKSPEQVLRQRYGDCKDKSVLLCKLLELEGIKAYPVLVNSKLRSTIKSYLPSNKIFDHCIVVVLIDKHVFWFDPTLSFQRGNLDSRYWINYGAGLVVKEGNNQIDIIPQSNYSEITSNYSIEVMSQNGMANMFIITKYIGYEADYLRAILKSTTLSKIEKFLLEYHGRTYSEIESTVPLKYNDDENNNIITLYENYRINRVWVLENEKDSNTIMLQFFPRKITENIRVPSTNKRRHPFLIDNYPTKIKEEFYITIPFPIPFKPSSKSVLDQYVGYSFVADKEEEGLIHLEYNFAPNKNVIDTTEFQEYLKDIKNIEKDLIFNIKVFDTGEYNFNYLQFFIVIIGFLLSALVLFFINKSVNYASSFTEREAVQLNIYVGVIYCYIIALLLAIRLLFYIQTDPDFIYSLLEKNSSNFSPGRFVIACLDSLFCSVLFIYSIYNLILFHARRTSFILHARVWVTLSWIIIIFLFITLTAFNFTTVGSAFISCIVFTGIHLFLAMTYFSMGIDNPYFNKNYGNGKHATTVLDKDFQQ